MLIRTRVALLAVLAGIVGGGEITVGRQLTPARSERVAPDFDIRDRNAPIGGVRTIHAHLPGLSGPERGSASDIARRFLAAQGAALLDLDPTDLLALRPRSATVVLSTRLREVQFDQLVDGVPVFGGSIVVQLAADGRVVGLASSAVSLRDQLPGGIVDAEEAVRLAAGNLCVELDAFHPTTIAHEAGPEQRSRMARGPLAAEPVASLVYFPMNGQLRSAWRVTVQPAGASVPYDVVVDGRSGRILLRRSGRM
jgi:hypothetical protein